MIELVEEDAGTLMTMTQMYPSQEVRDQTLNFMETQPGASGADGYDRLAEMVEERESDSEDVEVRLLPAQPVISIRATVKVADLAATMDDRLSALRDYLQRHGVQPAGAPFVRYHTFPNIGPDTEAVGDLETDVEEGVPVTEALPGEGRIASGELPGGPVVVIGFGRHMAWGMTSSFAAAERLLRIKVPPGRNDVSELAGELVPFEKVEQPFVTK